MTLAQRVRRNRSQISTHKVKVIYPARKRTICQLRGVQKGDQHQFQQTTQRNSHSPSRRVWYVIISLMHSNTKNHSQVVLVDHVPDAFEHQNPQSPPTPKSQPLTTSPLSKYNPTIWSSLHQSIPQSPKPTRSTPSMNYLLTSHLPIQNFRKANTHLPQFPHCSQWLPLPNNYPKQSSYAVSCNAVGLNKVYAIGLWKY